MQNFSAVYSLGPYTVKHAKYATIATLLLRTFCFCYFNIKRYQA